MTETTLNTDSTPTEAAGPLVQYGLYTHEGMIRFASDEHTLVDLTGNAGTTYTPTREQVEIFAMPGQPDWVDRMVRVRAQQASTINHLTRRNAEVVGARDNLLAWQAGIGEALRAEAIRREWCSEYDAFAEEWDLPKRFMNYDVTMTITVTASDEESALEMVRENFSLSSYSEGVLDGPDFDASEA